MQIKLASVSIFLAALIALSYESRAHVKTIQSHGFIVENSVHTSASIDSTWSVLINDIDNWWPKDHSWWMGTLSIEAKAGGCFCEVSNRKSAEHMRISFVDPGKVLRMTGGLGPLQGMGMYGALDWVFTEESNGTQISLNYRVMGLNPESFEQLAAIVDKVQAIQLQSLADYLANSK